MQRSFSIVDYKVSQAEFFLRKIQEAELDFFAAQCFTDAFASAARSITFAMQSVCKDIPEFSKWYSAKQEILKTDSLAQFFNRYRTASVHIGDTVVNRSGSYRDADGKRHVTYYFMEVPDIPNPPAEDVYSACKKHFVKILGIVLEAYQLFASQIDARWYFTPDNFQTLGKSIEQAWAELPVPYASIEAFKGKPASEQWEFI